MANYRRVSSKVRGTYSNQLGPEQYYGYTAVCPFCGLKNETAWIEVRICHEVKCEHREDFPPDDYNSYKPHGRSVVYVFSQKYRLREKPRLGKIGLGIEREENQ